MSRYILSILVVTILIGGWWYVNHQSPLVTTDTLQETMMASSSDMTLATSDLPAVGTKEYKGPWFKVSYPASFLIQQEGTDEATFVSVDGDVQFYVFSPQWAGNPDWYLDALPTETVVSDETTTPTVTPVTNGKVYSKKVTRYVTFAANDGSYTRSLISVTAGYVSTAESNDFGSQTNMVFGIKYKNQAAYDKYLKDYIAFKESLVQYAD